METLDVDIVKDLLENYLCQVNLDEVRVVRTRRTPASVRRKRKRYYRRRRAKLLRMARRRARKPRSKRLAKRRRAIRKRLHIRPGSRRRLKVASKDEIANLLEGVKAMDQHLAGKQENASLAEAFALTASVADKLIKKITSEQKERQKRKISEAKPDDDDLMALDLDDLPDYDDSEEDGNDDYGMDELPDDEGGEGGEEKPHPKKAKDDEKEEAKVLKHLQVLSSDAKKMESAVRSGKIQTDEAKVVLRKMLEYISPLAEDDFSLGLDAWKNNQLADLNYDQSGRDKGTNPKQEPFKAGDSPSSAAYGQTGAAASDLKKGVHGQVSGSANIPELHSQVVKGDGPGSAEKGSGDGGWKEPSDADLKKGVHGQTDTEMHKPTAKSGIQKGAHDGSQDGKPVSYESRLRGRGRPVIRENKQGFLTIAQVRAICPSCATKMESMNLKEIKASVVAEALEEALKKK